MSCILSDVACCFLCCCICFLTALESCAPCCFLAVGYVFYFHSTTIIHFLSKTLSSTLLNEVAKNNFLFIHQGDVLMLFGVFMLLEPLVKQSLWQKIGTKKLIALHCALREPIRYFYKYRIV